MQLPRAAAAKVACNQPLTRLLATSSRRNRNQAANESREAKSSHRARPFCQGLIQLVTLQEEPRLFPFPDYFSR